MDPVQLLVLALVQGITEFLPISSSAHLILVPVITGWQDQGLAFDIAVHLGTLLAVVGYFRARVARLIVAGIRAPFTRERDVDGRLAWLLVLGTVPVGLAGLLFKDVVETTLRGPLIIAAASIGFGLLLWWSDRGGGGTRDEDSLNWRDALFIGVFQAIALIPGTSRSGITMTAARALGYDRVDGARLALLMAMPATFAAGAYGAVDLVRTGNAALGLDAAIAAGLAFIAALVTLVGLMRMLRVWTMTPFALYRIALGAVLLWIAYG